MGRKKMVNCDNKCLYYKDGICSRNIAQHDENGNCIDRKERIVKVLISGEGCKKRQFLRNLLDNKNKF